MSTRWTTDKTTHLTDPFHLRRDALDVIEDEIASGGGGGGGVALDFTQSVATVSTSPPRRVVTDGAVSRVTLMTSSQPVGSDLTAEFERNGTTFATLSITDGSVTDASSTSSLPSVVAGDKITVSITSVGTTTPATGITAQVDL